MRSLRDLLVTAHATPNSQTVRCIAQVVVATREGLHDLAAHLSADSAVASAVELHAADDHGDQRQRVDDIEHPVLPFLSVVPYQLEARHDRPR
jgi:hypothetical protein